MKGFQGRKKGLLSDPIIVVGCGLVGIRFAETWLASNNNIPLLLFDADPHAPYDRINIGKLLQDQYHYDPASLSLSLPENHPRLRVHLNQAITQIDPESKTILTAEGRQYAYQSLVLATGAKANVLPIEGVDLKGVHVLRTLQDAMNIRKDLVPNNNVVIIGAGLLGVEIASHLLGMERRVHLIECHKQILSRHADPAIQETIDALVQFAGLEIHTDSVVTSAIGEEQITAVELANGTQLACDQLILSAGVHPDTKLAQQAGLATNRGIIVDDHLQTSGNDIYAIGDCSEHRGQTHGLVAPGYAQADVLVRHLNGEDVTYQGSKPTPRPKLSNVSNQDTIANLPVDSIICDCNQVTRGELSEAIRKGSHSMESLCKKTGAGINCGACRPFIAELIGSDTKKLSISQRILQVVAIITIIGGLLYLLLPGLGYQDTVIAGIQWDQLWRDQLSRQITGFTLLTVSIMISVIAIRKRANRFQWGELANWRSAHVLLGLLIMITLLIHTGARFGYQLDQILMLCFIGVLLSGGLLAITIANQHRFKPKLSKRLRLSALWIHLLLLWPLPALLLFHILKGYYY